MPGQRIQQRLIQTQKLSPQQIHLMKLLQMPVMGLEQRIKEEIEQNPVLEDLADSNSYDEENNNNNNDIDHDEQMDEQFDHEDELKVDADNEFSLEDYMGDDDDDVPYYKLYANNSSKDDERYEFQYSSGESLSEYLLTQINLRNITERQSMIAKQIIGNIDETGYLKRNLEMIADDLAFNDNEEVSVSEIEEVLHEIHQLDPPGIAARDLKECLSIQLNNLEETPYTKIAKLVIEKCFEEFTKKHYDKIISKLKITKDELKEAEQVIVKLNPKPGDSGTPTELNANYIYPDFSVRIVDEEPILSLTSLNTPDLRIKSYYMNMMKDYTSSSDTAKQEAADYLKKKIDSAKMFIDSIQQRQKTLYKTMSAIIERQKAFFITGDEIKLKPMILEDIANDIGMDISTVSRVVNSKYVSTPYGTYLLKFFFSESVQKDSGDEVSNREIKLILAECIKNEDKQKPLTDDELTGILNSKGYKIARRTTAKYRDQLGIPVARQRKEI